MAQSLGELYTTLSLRTGSYFQQVEEAADAIEELGSKAVSALGDVSEGFLSVAAVAGGFFAVASQLETQAARPLADAMKGLTDASSLFALEVGTTMLPLVRELTDWVKTGVAWWRSLSGETKGLIVDMVKWSAIIGGVGLGLSRLIMFGKGFAEALVVVIRAGNMLAGLNLFGAASSGLSSITAAIKDMPGTIAKMQAAFTASAASTWAMAAPVLAVMAAVAGLVALMASLRASWGDLKLIANDWGMAISDAMGGVGTALGSVVKSAGTAISSVFVGLKDFLMSAMQLGLEVFVAQVKAVAKYAENVARMGEALRVPGAGAMAERLANVQNLSADDMMAGVTAKVEAIWTKAGSNLDKTMEYVGQVASGAAARLKSDAKATAGALADPLGLFGSGGAMDAQVGMASVKEGLGLLVGDMKGWFAELRGVIPDGSGVLLPKFGKDEEDKSPIPGTEKVGMPWVPTSQDEFKVVQDTKAAFDTSAVRQAYDAMVQAARDAAFEAGLAFDKAAADFQAGLQEKLMGALGSAGALANSFMTGMAAGGPMGAAVSVGLDMLTRSQAFQDTMAMVEGVIQEIADGLGGFLAGLQPLVAVLGNNLMVWVDALSPLLSSLGEALSMLAVPMTLVGMLFKALAPLLEIISLPLKALELPLRFLFEVLRAVAIIATLVAIGIAEAWNGVLSGIQSILKGIGLSSWAKDLENAKLDTSKMYGALDELTSVTWESADAASEKAAADRRAAQAADSFSEALYNGPAGWKRALASFGAQDGMGPPASGGSQSPAADGGSSGGGPKEAPPAIVVEGDLIVNGTDPDDAMDALRRKAGAMQFQLSRAY